MLKVLISFGTRPEAIKMAPVISSLKNDCRFDVRVIVTAQHREMLDQVLDVFNIKPDYDLNLMSNNQTLNGLSARILASMDCIYDEFHPNIVLVHGDTLSAFIVALSAFYKNIQVGHVEAGLRTYNLSSPWPEEGNRQLISKIANLHFSPTIGAQYNLLNEGVNKDTIHVTGNTIIDSLMSVVNKKLPFPKDYNGNEFILNERRKILITGHRRENFGNNFINICSALRELSQLHQDIDFIYPVHMNPNVKKVVEQHLASIENVYLLPPQSYLEFVHLMKVSYLILTDSGGIQEEAPSLNIPVLVMRDTTERQEAIESGTVKLVGTTQESIYYWVNELLRNQTLYKEMANSTNPFGNGQSSSIIKNILIKRFIN